MLPLPSVHHYTTQAILERKQEQIWGESVRTDVMREPLELLDAAGGGHQHPRRQQLRRRRGPRRRLVPHDVAAGARARTLSHPAGGQGGRASGVRGSGGRGGGRARRTPGEVTTRGAGRRSAGSCPAGDCQAKWARPPIVPRDMEGDSGVGGGPQYPHGRNPVHGDGRGATAVDWTARRAGAGAVAEK